MSTNMGVLAAFVVDQSCKKPSSDRFNKGCFFDHHRLCRNYMAWLVEFIAGRAAGFS